MSGQRSPKPADHPSSGKKPPVRSPLSTTRGRGRGAARPRRQSAVRLGRVHRLAAPWPRGRRHLSGRVFSVGLVAVMTGVLVGGRVVDAVSPCQLALVTAVGTVAGLPGSAAATSLPTMAVAFGVVLGATTGLGHATAVRVAGTVGVRSWSRARAGGQRLRGRHGPARQYTSRRRDDADAVARGRQSNGHDRRRRRAHGSTLVLECSTITTP